MTRVRERLSSSLAHQIVRAVASREGVEPLDLEVPLYDAVDPEALKALFARPSNRSTDRDLKLSFTYYGYDIVVTGDRTVTVSDSTGGSHEHVSDGSSDNSSDGSSDNSSDGSSDNSADVRTH